MLEAPDTGNARFALSLLGEVEVVSLDGPGPASLTSHSKALAVLIYLLLGGTRRLVPRDRITMVFWPEVDEFHARGALRQTLRVLRDRLGAGALVRRGKEYVGVAEGVARCDAFDFERMIAQGRPADGMRLYRGHLMQGFPFRGTHAWEEWLEERRLHYRDLATGAAWTLAEVAERHGDPAAAAYWGKTAVGLAPTNEVAFCRLIELLARVGDRWGALRAYRGLERWLAAEFEAHPSHEMRRCIERIRQGCAPDSPLSPPRRAPGDRRREERRSTAAGYLGPERRLTGRDRRGGTERRQGGDRRAPQGIVGRKDAASAPEAMFSEPGGHAAG